MCTVCNSKITEFHEITKALKVQFYLIYYLVCFILDLIRFLQIGKEMLKTVKFSKRYALRDIVYECSLFHHDSILLDMTWFDKNVVDDSL